MVDVQTPEVLQIINQMIVLIVGIVENYGVIIMWVILVFFVLWVFYELMRVGSALVLRKD